MRATLLSIIFGASFTLCLTGRAVAGVTVTGRIADENGLAIASAKIELRIAPSAPAFAATSDIAGGFSLRIEAPGDYLIHAERPGFFVFDGHSDLREGSNQLHLTLNHLQDFFQSVDVPYSPPLIDPDQPAEQKQLNSVEILEAPYANSQDLRYALPLLPGVLQDVNGSVHVNGGSTGQTNFTLDGFNISDPVSGAFSARLNIEAVRSVDLDSSRYSADKDHGSAGSVDLKTGMGDDIWRFGATNFIPGISSAGGLHIDKWTPRIVVSGPIEKGRSWFYNAFDAFYDVNTVSDLPRGQNRSRDMTASDLTRLQVNLSPSNILTGSLLYNYIDRDRNGLSIFDPVSTTINSRSSLYFASMKDQIYFAGGALTEIGFASSRIYSRQSPQGDQIFDILPIGERGNYFEALTQHSDREQWISNTYLPAIHRFGAHQLRFGVDVQRSGFNQSASRNEYRVLREDLSVARSVYFIGNGFTTKTSAQASEFIEDRWAPVEALMIEAGVRADWDNIVRNFQLSPRFSAAYAPKWLGGAKVSAGIGMFHDALNLGILGRQDQVSVSSFYDPTGQLIRGPVETSFMVDRSVLRVPRSRILSFTVEKKLPFDLYGKASFIDRAGENGFSFVPELPLASGQVPVGGVYQLRNWRDDRYDAIELTLRRSFGGKFQWVGGYTRSSAHTDSVVDYSLENPIFSRQAPGPLPWDAPNRFLTWGWAPLPKSILPPALAFVTRDTTVAYLFEYRTGFPFSVVNDEGFLVGRPESMRLPGYFNMNLHFERRFRFLHYLWAWRVGVDNLTNNGNPNVVDNNIDSPTYLTYGRGQRRAVNVRLRFLGKS
jgi:hypothetical protein